MTFVAFQQPQPRESRLIQNNLKGHHLVWKKKTIGWNFEPKIGRISKQSSIIPKSEVAYRYVDFNSFSDNTSIATKFVPKSCHAV